MSPEDFEDIKDVAAEIIGEILPHGNKSSVQVSGNFYFEINRSQSFDAIKTETAEPIKPAADDISTGDK